MSQKASKWFLDTARGLFPLVYRSAVMSLTAEGVRYVLRNPDMLLKVPSWAAEKMRSRE
jgi:hypothetical protein